MNGIERADPGARRKAMLLVIFAAAIGAALIYSLERYAPLLVNWVRDDFSGGRLRIVFAMVAIAVSVPLLVFSFYLWRLGRRVIEVSRFPPPDMKLARDTPIVMGEPAYRRGRLFQIIAAVLTAVALFLPVLLFRLVTFLSAG